MTKNVKFEESFLPNGFLAINDRCLLDLLYTFGQFIWDYLRNFDPLILSFSVSISIDNFRLYFSIDLVVIRVVCRLKTNDAFGGLS